MKRRKLKIVSRQALVRLKSLVQQVHSIVPPNMAARLDEEIQTAVSELATALSNPECAPDGAVRLFALATFDAMARGYSGLLTPLSPVPAGARQLLARDAIVDNLRGALSAIGSGVLGALRPCVEVPERLETELLAHVERHIKVLMRRLRPAKATVPIGDVPVAVRKVRRLLAEGENKAAIIAAFANVRAVTGKTIAARHICKAAGYTDHSEFSKFRNGKASKRATALFSEWLSLTPLDLIARLKI